MRWFLLTFLLVPIILCQCSVNKQKISLTPPSWVLRVPMEKGVLYAVGNCGRTLIQKDAWERAADAARNELAKNVQAKVKNTFILVQKSNGSPWADEAFIVEATSSATNAVMEMSQVVALWYDEYGVVPGSKPGTTYVLSVMNMTKAIEEILPTIENKMPKEEYDKIISSLKND